MAFPLRDYIEMLRMLRKRGYAPAAVRDYFDTPPATTGVYLKHDVDRLVSRAVAMAEAEAADGIHATYYFRCDRSGRFPDAAIRHVAELGHEVGFHYECLSRERGDLKAAKRRFERELTVLREIAPVCTIAAHGAPLSGVSNMQFAKDLDLGRLSLLGDAVLNVDFERVLYVTDSGGVYGSPSNRRDWSQGRNWREPTPPLQLATKLDPTDAPLVMINSHPERWPADRIGVLQATLSDVVANGLKRLAAWRDG